MPCPGPHTGRPARPYFYDSHCLTSTETVCNNAASARSGCPDKSDKHHRLCPRVEVSRSEYDHTRGKFVVTVFSRVHSTLQPALSVRLLFQRLQAVLGLLLLPNCLVGLFHHSPCPPLRYLGSRVFTALFLENILCFSF